MNRCRQACNPELHALMHTSVHKFVTGQLAAVSVTIMPQLMNMIKLTQHLLDATSMTNTGILAAPRGC